MENLEIEDIADIGNVSVDILLKEMLNEYIENSIDGDLNLDNLKSVDFSNMGTSQIVEDALSDALSVFEKYYGED